MCATCPHQCRPLRPMKLAAHLQHASCARGFRQPNSDQVSCRVYCMLLMAFWRRLRVLTPCVLPQQCCSLADSPGQDCEGQPQPLRWQALTAEREAMAAAGLGEFTKAAVLPRNILEQSRHMLSSSTAWRASV